MKHITKQYGVETLIPNRKMAAVVRKIVDSSRCVGANIQAHNVGAEDAHEMVRNESVTASHIKDICVRRKNTRHLESHVVCAPDFSPPSHAGESPLDC